MNQNQQDAIDGTAKAIEMLARAHAALIAGGRERAGEAVMRIHRSASLVARAEIDAGDYWSEIVDEPPACAAPSCDLDHPTEPTVPAPAQGGPKWTGNETNVSVDVTT